MLLAEADVGEYLVPDELNDGGDVAGYVGAGDVAGVWLSDVVIAEEVFVGIWAEIVVCYIVDDIVVVNHLEPQWSLVFDVDSVDAWYLLDSYVAAVGKSSEWVALGVVVFDE